jgi:thymidine kinase
VAGNGGGHQHPRLEVIVGPMYSGKSAELVRRVTLAQIARLTVRVFRPRTDTRTAEEIVFSRNGTQVSARVVADVREMFRHLPAEVDVVGLDEAQFFPDDLGDAVSELLGRGIRVIAAGLDLDFAGRPFGPLPILLALADTVDKLTAVCMKCHSLYATRTQRLVNGEPAGADSPRVVVELGAESETTYEARCVACYQPPPRPNLQPSYWSSAGGE